MEAVNSCQSNILDVAVVADPSLYIWKTNFFCFKDKLFKKLNKGIFKHLAHSQREDLMNMSKRLAVGWICG